MPLAWEWHFEQMLYDGPDITNYELGLRFPLPLSPALLHHLRNSLSGSSAHMTARMPAATCAGASASTTAAGRTPATARAASRSFQGSDGAIKTLAFLLKVVKYTLNVHASPFGLL
jgi:hypothetical protein